jgi:hypothetical protein
LGQGILEGIGKIGNAITRIAVLAKTLHQTNVQREEAYDRNKVLLVPLGVLPFMAAIIGIVINSLSNKKVARDNETDRPEQI